MRIFSKRWTDTAGWDWPALPEPPPQLVLYFAATSRLKDGAPAVRELAERYPGSVVCGCSTAGEILDGHVFDESIVAVFVHFSTTRVAAVMEFTTDGADGRGIGRRAAERLNAPDLRHVLVLSDGLSVNGSALIAGLSEGVGPGAGITGGLAGDGRRFQRTFVGLGDDVGEGRVVAVGLYGPDVRISHGSRVGGSGFGPRRRISKSRGNTLIELDGQPALALYKRYLGDLAAGLPATGLLFPLELTKDLLETTGLLRTILGVDEAEQSLTFAGDMPEGWYARLVKVSSDQLVDGAAGAGLDSMDAGAPAGPGLALLVSCVGRRWVLGQRTEEELEAVIHELPGGTVLAGFYSYGEVCPSAGSAVSELHNQTMTITVISEAV
jgi:hypothetical protein